MEGPSSARSAIRFGLTALGWSLVFFGVLYLPWVQQRLLPPLTRMEKAVADWYAGGVPLPVTVGVSCSGADVIALCLGATLAFPVAWASRIGAALGGIALILSLNVVRIGTLGRAASRPDLFAVLHLYVWPAVLLLATAGYVFAWMWAASAGSQEAKGEKEQVPGRTVRRFVLLAGVALIFFTAAAPWIMTSQGLLRAAAGIARTAASILVAVGVSAHVSGNTLTTARGAFLVTQECVASSLIPLYCAAAIAFPSSWRRRLLALVVAPPLFAGLGVVRLLLLALPHALVGSPLWLVHGFSQLLLVLLAIAVASAAREGFAWTRWPRVIRRTLLSCLAGLVVVTVCGGALTRGMLAATAVTSSVAAEALPRLMTLEDGQGALRTLPACQLGLLAALAAATFRAPLARRLLWAFGLLAVCQLSLLVTIGELAARAGFHPHAMVVRGLAVAVPSLIAFLLARMDRRAAGTAARLPCIPHAWG